MILTKMIDARVLLLFLMISLLGQKLTANVPSENDPVLLRINGREITVSEFEYVYTKNNLNPQVMDPRSVEEYLELFINFNLKVHEAIQLGLDTQPSFIDELEGYRRQLAQPYLTDQEIANHLVDEALQRMQYDIRASHILISVEEHTSPSDTLAAWNKIIQLRNRALAGEDFGQLAQTYSDDPSAKGMPATANRPAMRANMGDLGYFSVLDMVYPFENTAYNTPVSEISMPVRTNFGYHIIKVHDRLPALGRARVAHIMVNLPADAPEAQSRQAREKIEEIYARILAGEDFASLAERFSDDRASGRRGGEMPPFTSNRMVPEFIKAIASLDQPNQISEPVRTQYGWHVIKLIEKVRPTHEEAVAELKNKISRDLRANLSQQAVVERLKIEYGFSEKPENLQLFFDVVDQSIFEGRWSKQGVTDLAKVLFSFAGMDFTRLHFANYLEAVQSMRTPESVRNYVNTMYNNFVTRTILDYEESKLAEKYPDFRMIMREYHDGILLFELTDQKVWSKAMQDTTGLREFFNANQQNYTWQNRMDVVIYTFNSESAARNGRKAIRRAVRRNVDHEQLMSEFNATSQLEVSAEKGVFELEEKPLLAQLPARSGVSGVMQSNQAYIVVHVREFLPARNKRLNEIRGLVIADYQNYLEQRWVEELREKYNFTLYRDALNHLKSQ